MAEMKPELTLEQAIRIASKGLFPGLHVVLYDLPKTMIVRNIQTNEPTVIFKD